MSLGEAAIVVLEMPGEVCVSVFPPLSRGAVGSLGERLEAVRFALDAEEGFGGWAGEGMVADVGGAMGIGDDWEA